MSATVKAPASTPMVESPLSLSDLPKPETEIQAWIAIIVTIIVAVVVFMSNYVQSFANRWVVMIGVLLVGICKFSRTQLPGRSSYEMYWNILFLILILIATYLVTDNNIDHAKYSAYIFAISCFIDLLVVAYFSYLSYKMLNMVLPADDFDKKKLATLKMSNMVAGASIILGDLLVLGDFAYAIAHN